MKQIAKTIGECFAVLMAVPLWLFFGVQSTIFGPERAFVGVSQAASLFPGLFGEYLRRVLFRSIAGRVGRDVVISFGTVLTKRSIELGDGVYVGSYCMLGDVRIGDDTLIADHVCIPSGPNQHDITRLDLPIREQPGRFHTVRVGRDCWIAGAAIILADVGNHCVVAAGSVVTKPVDDYQIVAGNPAKPIGDRRHLSDKTNNIQNSETG